MTPSDPDHVTDTARTLRDAFELRILHPTLLRAQDRRTHRLAIEALRDGLLRSLESEVQGRSVRQ